MRNTVSGQLDRSPFTIYRHLLSDIGEVWANMLHGVYADLVAARGYANDALTNPNGSGGNTMFMHLMMDGWALQPCNPTCKFSPPNRRHLRAIDLHS